MIREIQEMHERKHSYTTRIAKLDKEMKDPYILLTDYFTALQEHTTLSHKLEGVNQELYSLATL